MYPTVTQKTFFWEHIVCHKWPYDVYACIIWAYATVHPATIVSGNRWVRAPARYKAISHGLSCNIERFHSALYKSLLLPDFHSTAATSLCSSKQRQTRTVCDAAGNTKTCQPYPLMWRPWEFKGCKEHYVAQWLCYTQSSCELTTPDYVVAPNRLSKSLKFTTQV